jgi:hypothetical protein
MVSTWELGQGYHLYLLSVVLCSANQARVPRLTSTATGGHCMEVHMGKRGDLSELHISRWVLLSPGLAFTGSCLYIAAEIQQPMHLVQECRPGGLGTVQLQRLAMG